MITHLVEGKKAPAFTGIDQKGNKVSLSDFKGQKIVLYFYPQDMTATCTVQACNLRDHFEDLTAHGFVVIGVSPDDVARHQKFEERNKLPFILLADTKQTILKKYGVWGEKQMFGNKYMGVHRTTFIIDEKGFIRKIYHRPKSKEHAQEILKDFAS